MTVSVGGRGNDKKSNGVRRRVEDSIARLTRKHHSSVQWTLSVAAPAARFHAPIPDYATFDWEIKKKPRKRQRIESMVSVNLRDAADPKYARPRGSGAI